jgi:hypothetical protein
MISPSVIWVICIIETLSNEVNGGQGNIRNIADALSGIDEFLGQ